MLNKQQEVWVYNQVNKDRPNYIRYMASRSKEDQKTLRLLASVYAHKGDYIALATPLASSLQDSNEKHR